MTTDFQTASGMITAALFWCMSVGYSIWCVADYSAFHKGLPRWYHWPGLIVSGLAILFVLLNGVWYWVKFIGS